MKPITEKTFKTLNAMAELFEKNMGKRIDSTQIDDIMSLYGYTTKCNKTSRASLLNRLRGAGYEIIGSSMCVGGVLTHTLTCFACPEKRPSFGRVTPFVELSLR